jgi:hypothetical protein
MTKNKNRKSESQERFEQADNAGRFAGNDADAQAAKQQAVENIRQDSRSTEAERNQSGDTNAEAHRNPTRAEDYKGEAQNVNDDTGRPMEGPETQHAVNKANEGLRQGREGT